jgi:hypothetical protein
MHVSLSQQLKKDCLGRRMYVFMWWQKMGCTIQEMLGRKTLAKMMMLEGVI